MRLSLLTPPTDSPRTVPQVPVPRNWPGEAQIAVNTGALPRSLPVTWTPMDPNASSAPMEALARLGATGAAVGTQTLNLVLEASARKQEATNLASAEQIYSDTVVPFERAFEEHKVTSTAETFLPGYDEMWQQAAAAAMAKAPNPEVAYHLGRKLQGYRLTTNADAASVDRAKFQDAQQMQFQRTVRRDMKFATEAETPAEHAKYMRDLEATFRAFARGGAIPLAQIETEREKAFDAIRTDRAYNQGFLRPLETLTEMAAGETYGLDTKESRTFAKYLEDRIRTLNNDREALEARQRRETQAEQDAFAMTMRARISENYTAGGAGIDLTTVINEKMRDLGETNHAQALEMNRVYLERSLRPVKVDDTVLSAEITTAYREGRIEEYTDRDLLRLLKNGALGPNYERLSDMRAQIVARRASEAKSGQHDADRARKDAIENQEKVIRATLKRGNVMLGDPTSILTGQLAEDAVAEFGRRLAAEPTAQPEDVARKVIVGRLERIPNFIDALPYKTVDEVLYAAHRGWIDQASADLYVAMLLRLQKAPGAGGGAGASGTKTAPMPGESPTTEADSPVRKPK